MRNERTANVHLAHAAEMRQREAAALEAFARPMRHYTNRTAPRSKHAPRILSTLDAIRSAARFVGL